MGIGGWLLPQIGGGAVAAGLFVADPRCYMHVVWWCACHACGAVPAMRVVLCLVWCGSESGIVRMEWAVGTSAGATDIMPWRYVPLYVALGGAMRWW